jgi:hypothetical protein
MWQPALTAPFDRNLELAVIEGFDAHALVFACRRTPEGWSRAEIDQRIDLRPTHWREWKASSLSFAPPPWVLPRNFMFSA